MRNDQDYLQHDQYRDESKLNARATLHERFSANPLGWHNWVFDQLDLPKQCRILEVGSGPGFLWQANSQRIPSGWEIMLTDFSPGMIEAARNALVRAPHDFTFEVCSADNIPQEAESFDAVIANHMLYHVPDLNAALREFLHVLAPDGRLFAATNGQNHMAEIANLLRQVDPTIPYDASSFLRRFGLENGREAIAAFFSEVEILRYPDQLLITETEPLVDYIVSAEPITDAQSERLRSVIDNEIAAYGVLRINKDSGLFRARKA